MNIIMETATQKQTPKITLIYPGIGLCGFGQVKINTSGEVHWIHHGIASIGASAKKAGYNVNLIDMRTLDSWEDFEKLIAGEKSDIVGISISSMDSKVAMEAIDIIKELNPQTKIVVGGINVTVFPEKYSENIKIDYIVTGEGEITFVKIINAIVKNGSWPRVSRGEKPNLDDLPWVNREMFDYSRELGRRPWNPGERTTPSITMIAGRGCPYQCTYCQPAESLTYGKPHRMRSPENVIEEMKTLKNKYDFKSVTFWDDTFTLYPQWVYKFCDLYEKENFGSLLAICSRTDIICRNEDMMKRLKEVGLDLVMVGFESGSQRMLDFLKKGTTIEQNYKAAAICKKYGIKMLASFMLGLPTETKEEQEATIKMINDTKPEIPAAFYFLPIMGTEIYQFCKDNDLILPEYKENFLNIERTKNYRPRIKNVDYEFLDSLRTKIYNYDRGGNRVIRLIKKGLSEPSKIIPFIKKKLSKANLF